MSCILRVYGTNLNIDQLQEMSLKAYLYYKKGEPRIQNSKRLNRKSAAQYLASDADFGNFETQKEDVIRFLRDNASSLKEIMNIPEVISPFSFVNQGKQELIIGDESSLRLFIFPGF